MDSWKAFDVFLCFLLLSIKTVNSAQVFTVIRDGNSSSREIIDRFTFDSGCENHQRDMQAWCKRFNAENILGITNSCTCMCEWGHSTFLLAKGECVENKFVWSSSSMGYGNRGKEDHFSCNSFSNGKFMLEYFSMIKKCSRCLHSLVKTEANVFKFESKSVVGRINLENKPVNFFM